MTLAQAFELAVQHHQAGRLAEAEALYRQILAAEPRHAEALHLLGVIAHQAGRSDAAVEIIRQAIALAPQQATFHANLGEAYRELGRREEAVAAYRHAVALQPDIEEAHNNLGNVLSDEDRVDEAIASFRRAIEIRPGFPEARNNLGIALAKQGRLDEAIAEYCGALEQNPEMAEPHFNLGNAFSQKGHGAPAIDCYRRALALQPGHAAASRNLGNALAKEGRLEEAIAAYRRAVELAPDLPDAHFNLGNTLREQGRGEAAMASFRRTIELQPTFAEAHNNLGGELLYQGRFDEAAACFRTALQLQPDLALAHTNLLNCLRYQGELDAEAMFREHRRWDEVHARPLAESLPPCANDPHPDRRLRLGYVSPDFRLHSVAFFVETLLVSHDRRQVEIFCYADLRRADAVTARLREQAGEWREITGRSDAQVAELIRQDRIDILVDLAGHTAGSRLLAFARRPAPVQVSWLGYWDTTGMAAMDYRLTDRHADPPGATEHLHTEQLVRLPETFACFRPADGAPPVGPLPALARGQVTFASFHTLHKLHDRLLACWARLLQQVPGARLLLVVTGLDETGCRTRLGSFFARHGIGPERLEFRGRVALPEYLALHQEVDVLLDAHPFSGHTVSCHALWMGVPVVTLAGDRHCARMVASVLQNVGLPELIAQTPEQYVELAVALAADLPRLTALRASLRARMAASPLTDGPRFARNVEAAYRQMWRRWCKDGAAFPSP